MELSDNLEIQTKVREALESQERILLGPRASHELEKDPKHLLFVLSRYKFVAKLLPNRGRLLEIGAGDGLGASLVAQSGNEIVGIDLESLGLDEAAQTSWTRNHITFEAHDMVAGPFTPSGERFDGAYSLDVIEHIHPDQERKFLANIVSSIHESAPLIIGTPNETAKPYASKEALEQHINWKTHESLFESCAEFYENVFMFGMNDEVVHTGYAPMAHYLFALCVQRRS
jgi:2-polyprenyl-3-methyl-5-hydroxy-6-metoxy-1,4-benzoquinol methylase